jgi:probable O-glycosylation ligase (exosortase A-associated)
MRGLALLMFVAATLPMAFMRPLIGLMLWIMFSYMNPHRIAFGFATSFPWVMITAVITLISMSAHADQRQPLKMTPILALMTLFLAWTGFTTLFAVESSMAQAEWIRFFKILMMAYVTAMLVTDPERLRWVLWTIVLSFGFWGFKGGLFTLVSGGGYHVLGPIKSFFRDNNDFALVMCMTLPLMRYLQLYEKNKWVQRGLWVLMGFTVLSVVGTYSRGGFLALAAVAFMLLIKSRRRAGLIVVAPMLVLAIGAFMPQQYFSRIHTIHNYQHNQSAEGRIDSWKFATNVALANPITGGGFDVWASDYQWNTYGPPGATHRAIHSIWFEVLGEQGFIGLIIFVSMLLVGWLSLARIRKQARGSPELAWMGDLASMIQVSFVGFVAAGTFLPMPYFDLFYQLIAIVTVMQVFMLRQVGKRGVVAAQSQTPAESGTKIRKSRSRHKPRGSRPKDGGTRGTQGLPWW